MTFEEYMKIKNAHKKAKEEEDKSSSSASSTSKKTSGSKGSSGNKTITKTASNNNDMKKRKESGVDIAREGFINSKSFSRARPFYDAVKKEKDKSENLNKVKQYATGQVDSTVAENMGVNTGEVDNITNKMSRRQINQAFKPAQSTSKQENKAENDYSERPTTMLKVNGGRADQSQTFLSATPEETDESYKFSSEEDYAEYLRNKEEIRKLQVTNNNSRRYGITEEKKKQNAAKISSLQARNNELIKPYETKTAEENTDYLDTLPLSDIAGAYTRYKAAYRDEDGKNLTDGDEYKSWQKYYFYRLANDAGTNPEFKKYYNKKATTDFPKLEYKGNVTRTRLDANTKALKLNSYYEYMTPEERHYFNYLGTTEDGSLLQNDYAEMLLPNLMTRKASEKPASNPFMQVVESYVSGVGSSLNDAAKGVQQTFGIGNYWKDEEPQYGTVKNQVDTANAGTLQKIVNMAANSTGYMTPSLVTSYLTGGASAASALGGKALKAASMVPMFLSSSGSTYSDALNSGASNEQARTRGFLKGLSEVGTQSVLGGVSKFGGNRLVSALAKTGAGEKAIKTASNVVDKLKNPYVKSALVNAGKIAGNASSEMFEEYLQDYVIAPLIENMTGGNAKLDLWDENSLYTLATAAISASALNAPSDVANITSDFKKAGEINRNAKYDINTSNLTSPQNPSNEISVFDESGMNKFLSGFQQSPSHNAENPASPFNMSEKQTLSNQVGEENANTPTEQNRGDLEGDVSNYSPETQDVLSKLTTAGRNLLLSGNMSAAQIDSLANEINDPTSSDNSKSARRERIKNALAEVQDFYEIQNNYVENLATEANAERFAKDVDSVFRGEKSKRQSVLIGNTPKILLAYGAKKLPITILQNTMYKIAYPTGYFGAKENGHNLGIPALKQLPKQLSNPMAILKSNSQKDSIIILTEWIDTNGNPVIIPLHLNKNGVLGVENSVASAYGKGDISSLLTDENGHSNILYTKNNEDIQSLLSAGLQLPAATRDDTLINSVPQTEPSVNPENSQNPTEQLPSNGERKTDVLDMFVNRASARQKVKNDVENLDNHTMSALSDFRNPNAQFMAKTDKSTKKDPLAMTTKQQAVYNITDAGGAVKEEAKAYGDNVLYQAYDNAKNHNAMVQNSIVNGQHDINGNRLGDSILDVLTPYLEDMENNSDTWIQLQRYVYNKLDPERSTEGKTLLERGAKYKTGELEQVEQEHPEFKDAQQQLVKFFDNLLQLRVDSGLMSAEAAELFRKTYPDYVPAHRNMPDDAEASADVEDLYGMDVSSLKELAKGSELQILPLQEQLLTATTKTYRNATLNQVYNRLADNYFKNPAKSKHIKSVYQKPTSDFKAPKFSAEFLINGEKYIMEMDEFLYKGMEDLAKGMKVSSVSWLEKPTKLFKELTTDKNISFILKNAVRDAGSVVMFSEHPAQYTKSAFKYIGETAKAGAEGIKAGVESEKALDFVNNFVEASTGRFKNDAYLDLYFAVGATNSGLIDIDSDSNFFGEKSESGIKKVVKAPLNGIERVNWVVENIPRFLEFAATLDAEGNNIRQRIENGETLTAEDKDVVLRAAYNAAKITANFKVGGKVVRTLNKNGVPYLNATTQGLLQLYRNFADIKITSAKNAEGNAKIAGSLMLKTAQLGIPVLLVAALRNAFKDEEWWKKETDHNKQKYIYFGENFRILKSEAFVLIDGLGMIFQKISDGKYPGVESVKDDVTALLLDSSPNPVMSNLAAPFLRVGFSKKNPGKTYWGGDIESAQLREIDDVTERYEENTSLVARWLSKAIGGAFGWSPVKVEELIDSYGGGVADFLLASTRPTFVSDVKNGQIGSAFSTLSEPFTKHFIPDKLKATQITSDYYNMKEQLSDETPADKFTRDFFNGNNSKRIKELNEEYKKAKNFTNDDALIKSDRRSKLLGIKEERDKLMQDSINNVPKYRVAAEKVLAKYPDYVYDPDNDRYNSYIKMQIDYKYGGAEYALNELDSETYKKAQEINSENGVSYDDIYKYHLQKKSLPKDIKSSEETKQLEDWLLDEVSSKRMDNDSAAALASVYMPKTSVSTKIVDYDFLSRESMIISKMTPTEKERYEIAKNVFGGMSAENYEYYKKNYDKGGNKLERLSALYEVGMTKGEAEIFHKIQSGAKGYQTASSPETQLKKNLNLHSSATEEIVKGYKEIIHSDPKEEDKRRRTYLQNIIKYHLPDEMRAYYGDEKIFNTMYNILSVY